MPFNVNRILRKLDKIATDVETLNAQVCELEALQLRRLTQESSKEDSYHQCQEVANLTSRNNEDSMIITARIKDVEHMLKAYRSELTTTEMKLCVKKFLQVLQHSVRIIEDYRMMQQSYETDITDMSSVPRLRKNNMALFHIDENSTESISSSSGNGGNRRRRRHQENFFRSFLLSFCGCASASGLSRN